MDEQRLEYEIKALKEQIAELKEVIASRLDKLVQLSEQQIKLQTDLNHLMERVEKLEEKIETDSRNTFDTVLKLIIIPIISAFVSILTFLITKHIEK
ncbi:hypothetical protein [Hydrogenobacter thermophilus]|jgi:chromosome segregation ATPase|uniref:hypothetical protein n=1 Tax=Hydrogenobacter thermophilus TaxID=940 RepID=UPI0030F68C3B